MPLSRETPLPASDPAQNKNINEGTIFDIQRWSLNDGRGIRTVVFFKGCPLKCTWCCNPESQSFYPELGILGDKCRDCGKCENLCTRKTAIPASEGGFRDSSACIACGACVEGCTWGAREMMGKKYTLSELMEVIKRDMPFYRRSGGGVTFSGGEATSQPEFLHSLAEKCFSLGIDIALETCGHFSWENLGKTLKMMDLVFLDIKNMDQEIHRLHTGVNNSLILENAINISRAGIPLVIRVPVIPGINDSGENIRATALFVRANLNSALGIELLPYHALGIDKYKSLGRTYDLQDICPPSDKEMEGLKHIVRSTSVEVLSF